MILMNLVKPYVTFIVLNRSKDLCYNTQVLLKGGIKYGKK